MRPTRFGLQPGRAALDRERWTIARAAREIDVNRQHLGGSLLGRVIPCPEVRERLPKLIGVPLEELFTPEVLARPYKVGRPFKSWVSAG